eukprot:2182598-Pleurochrysis_carterae.AAC.2
MTSSSSQQVKPLTFLPAWQTRRRRAGTLRSRCTAAAQEAKQAGEGALVVPGDTAQPGLSAAGQNCATALVLVLVGCAEAGSEAEVAAGAYCLRATCSARRQVRRRKMQRWLARWQTRLHGAAQPHAAAAAGRQRCMALSESECDAAAARAVHGANGGVVRLISLL